MPDSKRGRICLMVPHQRLAADRHTAVAAAVHGGRKNVTAQNQELFTPSGSVFCQESIFGVSCAGSAFFRPERARQEPSATVDVVVDRRKGTVARLPCSSRRSRERAEDRR
ncbi:hypothetical protein JCGZ_13888 [Jatropha curcas]|uniref:Uncharacterized protein n=1 Tax=Jatropha curcas TaxID=180498 RepID=A0A067JW39_JATCU|nr:hypothetical protein JCGZ_13888 [Jatropha curcas]